MANIVSTEAWATVNSTKGTALPETKEKHKLGRLSFMFVMRLVSSVTRMLCQR